MLWNRKPAHAGPQEDLANLKITDARVGDTLSISGAAEDFSDVDFTVDRLDVFEAGEGVWKQLSGEWRGRRVFVEVHQEDNAQVLGNFDGRTLTVDELGLSEDDLAEIDQRQNNADFFDWNGKFWLFRWSREVGVFSGGSQTGRGFYGWQFEEQGGKRFMNIRKFEGEPFAASLWIKIEPADIMVFRGT